MRLPSWILNVTLFYSNFRHSNLVHWLLSSLIIPNSSTFPLLVSLINYHILCFRSLAGLLHYSSSSLRVRVNLLNYSFSHILESFSCSLLYYTQLEKSCCRNIRTLLIFLSIIQVKLDGKTEPLVFQPWRRVPGMRTWYQRIVLKAFSKSFIVPL